MALVFAWAMAGLVAEAAQQKLTAFDGAANDQFGFAVAISGDSSIVGARGDDAFRGSAYVFVGAGLEQKLTASDGSAGDEFGRAVAISGDTAIVGAAFDDVGANVDQGSAYVFVRIGGVWTQQQMLTANDGAAGDDFGSSVAISGDTAVVGAPSDDAGQGSAYVFVRSGSTWTQQQQLTVIDGVALDFFGGSVAIEGDTAIVGAPGEVLDRGSAYAFVRTFSVWTLQQKLTASDGAAGDFFGGSVAIAGETALIGARGDDIGANAFQGSAYVFVRSVLWTQQAKLTANDGAAVDQFGLSVAISGDIAIVGSPNADVDANDDRGAAYVFIRSGGIWTQQAKQMASDAEAGDRFGGSVAIHGDTAVVGAAGDDIRTSVDQGSAYLIDGVLTDPSHDVGIAGGGFRTAGHVNLDSPTREMVIKIKNFGDHPESDVPFDVTSADGPTRVYSAACSGNAASVSPDGDLDPGEVVAIDGCTVTYTVAGDYSHTLTVSHGTGLEQQFDGNPSNNTRTKSTTVVP
jgi:hypothetical protein